MKDYMMNELQVGDMVVYATMINNSACFSFGRVSGFTPKKVRVGNTTVAPHRIVKIVAKDGLGASSNLEERV